VTVRRSTWGPVGILARRQPDKLSKTMAVSLAVHVLFFALVILSQVLSKLNKPNYQSFQVDLIASGPGQASPGRGAQKKVRSASKKSVPSLGKTSPSTKPQKKAATTAPVKTRTVAPKVSPSKPPALTAPPKPPEKAPAAVQDDPDRLEEWWKKQSKSMKVAKSTTAKKQTKVVTPKRRTAKIDIERKSIVVPPAKTNSRIIPKKIDPLATKTAPSRPSASPEMERKSPATDTLSLSGRETDGAGSDQNKPTETASLGSTDQDGRIGASGGASTGSTRFAFPGYLQRIDSKIRWQWAPPPVSPDEDDLVVRFDIRKNGDIDKTSVVVEESSGNTFFDQAALRAVYAAHPFPPLPDAYSDSTLTVYMHFIVKEAS